MLLGKFWFGKHFRKETIGISSLIRRAVTHLTESVLLSSDSVGYYHGIV